MGSEGRADDDEAVEEAVEVEEEEEEEGEDDDDDDEAIITIAMEGIVRQLGWRACLLTWVRLWLKESSSLGFGRAKGGFIVAGDTHGAFSRTRRPDVVDNSETRRVFLAAVWGRKHADQMVRSWGTVQDTRATAGCVR